MRTRFIAAMATLLLLLALTGCSSQSSPDSAKSDSGVKPDTSGLSAGGTTAGPQATNKSPSSMYGSGAGSTPGSSGSGSGGPVITPPQVTPPSGAGTAWCETGLGYSAPDATSYGFSEMKIVGLVQFKGKTYCKAEYKMESNGQNILYSIYFLEHDEDAWLVMDVNGQVQEIHVSE